MKWADKSTTGYDMLDFKSYIKSLQGKYLVFGRHMLKIRYLRVKLFIKLLTYHSRFIVDLSAHFDGKVL